MERTLSLTLLALFVVSTAAQDNVCFRPQLSDNIEMEGLQRYFNPGAELALSCKHGYTPISGPRTIVCAASGEWTKTKYKCIPKRCPHPGDLSHGDMYYEDNVYQSTINYTCYEGYTLTGDTSSVCLANGTWSTPLPQCTAVTCGLAPIPQNGMIIYDMKITGNITEFGVGVLYKCRPPFALFGEARGECTASGDWTETPECRMVSCPPPENIDRGYMSINDQRDFDFMEKVNYGCHGDYVLDGSLEIVCQKNGNWSEKPSCKAPCSVDIQRARIIHKGQRIWIKSLSPKRILHREIISVFCMDKIGKCGYAVPTQCIDGKLKIPDCFEEPRQIDYSMRSTSLPSEIRQC
ncbi:beta-2-glycoprotein 1-like [Notolabrus celidotus]|uniref:beta-2-glycoprotein 1-like n=1 Tax=Notolabrus celidotus TaxID=1203425 RepID=UPI00148FCBFB|nr:beta-2-glycoprotein 1-like [Notolabrus celidotus]